MGLARLPLDVVDCPDRRLPRAALELASDLADGQTEVSMLLPRRSYGRAWRRVLHDQTADRVVDAVSQLSHVNATIVPFLVAPGPEERRLDLSDPLVQVEAVPAPRPKAGKLDTPIRHIVGTTPVSELAWRRPARVAGRVRALRVQPLGGVPSLECTLVDASGEALVVVFLGRRSVAGVGTGSQLLVEGMVGKHRGKLALINPLYELLGAADTASADA